MAKQIKFNLIVDGHGIRSIDELKENFNINDVMEHYENGTLLRWLEVREYNEYADKIRQIDTLASLEEKANVLFSIFDFSINDKNVKQAIFVLLHTKQREQALKELNIKNEAADKIIENYIACYEKAKDDIKQNINDDQFVQNALSELNNKYSALLKVNRMDFYLQFKNILPYIMVKISENPNLVYDLNETIAIKDLAYTMLKAALKSNATNLLAIKRIVDTISNNFFIDFIKDYENFFYEVKDSHPLIVYGLLMNSKTNNLLLFDNKNEENAKQNKFPNEITNIGKIIFQEFSKINNKIDIELLHYFNRCYEVNKNFVNLSSSPVLIISMKNIVARECPNKNGTHKDCSINTNFLLWDSLEVRNRYGDGAEILYMKIPNTSDYE